MRGYTLFTGVIFVILAGLLIMTMLTKSAVLIGIAFFVTPIFVIIQTIGVLQTKPRNPPQPADQSGKWYEDR